MRYSPVKRSKGLIIDAVLHQGNSNFFPSVLETVIDLLEKNDISLDNQTEY